MKILRKMAALVPDEKCGVCLDKKYFCLMTNAAGYYPGPLAPITAFGTPLLEGTEKVITIRALLVYSRNSPPTE